MKIQLRKPIGEQASTLVVTLIICAILAISVLGYLSLIEQQGVLSRRSQSWNVAIAVVEAGIEDALQQLNYNATNLTADGWTASGDFYWKSNVLTTGTSYYARIWATNLSRPEIVSQAYVNPYGLVQATPSAMFAAINTTVAPSGIARAVRVKCRRGSLFIRALAAKHIIDMNGNNITTDSFDSGDPALSAPGGLYTPSKVSDNGDVASNDSIINSVLVGNANIFGHVSTGPGGTVSILNGAVGSHDWQLTHTGFQPGWVTDDSNFTFPDTSLPYTSGLTPSAGDIVEQDFIIVTNSFTTTNAPTDSPWGGVKSNVISTSLVSSPPNPLPPGTTTNTTITTTSYFPTTVPSSGVRTNITGSTTATDYPSGMAGPIITNSLGYVTVTTCPNPVPAGTVTNVVWAKDKLYYPAEGTYVGVVIPEGSHWSYWEIVSYTFPIFSYTYYNYTYTYPVYTYTIPTYSYTYGLYQTNVIWVTNHYDHILQSGKYYVDVLSGKTIVLGQAELVCGNGINMTGSDILKIAKGGSLTNWIGGTSATITGNGVINQTGLAQNYVAMFADSVTKLYFSGNGEFIGVIVAPFADAMLSGGGKSVFDYIGCLMVNSAKLNGHYRFHYDENLARLPGNGRYLITKWDEIPPIP